MRSETGHLPVLSIHDPPGEGSTSLDPLGLTPIGEQLAVELIPGVRERQRRPRYLTAVAVSYVVCQEFPEDAVATDGVSPPWQVFEWYLVEGMVRCAKADSEVSVPGSQKARKAIERNLPLNAARYLKSPAIFGFHGVYRLLARTLGVEQSGRLSDFGCELVEVWQREQGLPGFLWTAEGRGRGVRKQLTDAVRAGLKAGATDHSASWTGWRFFSDHLEPTRAGRKEAALIWRQLRAGTTGFRSEVLDFIVSKTGRTLLRDADFIERLCYAALKKVASAELKRRVETIERYEWFCRLVQDAFDACRYEITQARRGVPPSVLAKLRPVRRAAVEVPEAYAIAAERLTDQGIRSRFEATFRDLAEKRAAGDFVVALYEHHLRVQKAKPPEGKSPWLEQHFDGSLLIRPEYQLDDAPVVSREFVNRYRIVPLRSFALDLRRL